MNRKISRATAILLMILSLLTNPLQAIAFINSRPMSHSAKLNIQCQAFVEPLLCSTSLERSLHAGKFTPMGSKINRILKLCKKIENQSFYSMDAVLQETIHAIREKAKRLTAIEIEFLTLESSFVASDGYANSAAAFKLLKKWLKLDVPHGVSATAKMFLERIEPALELLNVAVLIPGTEIRFFPSEPIAHCLLPIMHTVMGRSPESVKLEISTHELAHRMGEELERIKEISPTHYETILRTIYFIRYTPFRKGRVASADPRERGAIKINWPFSKQDIPHIDSLFIEESDHHQFFRAFPEKKLIIDRKSPQATFSQDQQVYGHSHTVYFYLAELHAAMTQAAYFVALEKGSELDSVLKTRAGQRLDFEKRRIQKLATVLATVQNRNILTVDGESVLQELLERAKSFGTSVRSYSVGNTFISRLFLWFGHFVEEISHGVQGEFVGFHVRWNTLSAWMMPGIEIDEMAAAHDIAAKTYRYHQRALSVIRAGLKGNVAMILLLTSLEMVGSFIVYDHKPASVLIVGVLSLALFWGIFGIASCLAVILGNAQRLEPDSDTQRALYHLQELNRIANGSKKFGQTGKELFVAPAQAWYIPNSPRVRSDAGGRRPRMNRFDFFRGFFSNKKIPRAPEWLLRVVSQTLGVTLEHLPQVLKGLNAGRDQAVIQAIVSFLRQNTGIVDSALIYLSAVRVVLGDEKDIDTATVHALHPLLNQALKIYSQMPVASVLPASAPFNRRQFMAVSATPLLAKVPILGSPQTEAEKRLEVLISKYVPLTIGRNSQLNFVTVNFVSPVTHINGYSPLHSDAEIESYLATGPLANSRFEWYWNILERSFSNVAQSLLLSQRIYDREGAHAPGNFLDLAELQELSTALQALDKGVFTGQPPFLFCANAIVHAKAEAILKEFEASPYSYAELRGIDPDWLSSSDSLRLYWGQPKGKWTISAIESKMYEDLRVQTKLCHDFASQFLAQLHRLADSPYAPDGVQPLLEAFDHGLQTLATNPWTQMSERYWKAHDRFFSNGRSPRVKKIEQEMRAQGYRKSIPTEKANQLRNPRSMNIKLNLHPSTTHEALMQLLRLLRNTIQIRRQGGASDRAMLSAA